MRHRVWAYLAAAWAIAFAAPHVYWAAGATPGLRTALSDDVVANAGWPFQLLNAGIAVSCLAGAATALATLWIWPARWHRLARRVLLGLVWFGAVLLIARSADIYVEFTLGLTGVRDVPAADRDEYLRLARWFMFFWLPWFVLGALAWTTLAWTFTRLRGGPRVGGIGNARTPPVGQPSVPRRPPRWPVIAAYSVPLLVLPSAAWRLHTALFESTACHDPSAVGRTAYMVFLSLASLGIAGLTIGLVRPWGEALSRWLPRWGGRPIPPRAVVVSGVLGATVLCGLTAYAIVNGITGWVGPLQDVPPDCEPPGAEVLGYYMPLVAWGPVLLAVTLDYRRRHRDTPSRVFAGPGGVQNGYEAHIPGLENPRSEVSVPSTRNPSPRQRERR